MLEVTQLVSSTDNTKTTSTKKQNILPGVFVFVAGTDGGGVEDGATLSRAEPDVCTSSNVDAFGGDGVGATVLGAAVATFDAGATALGADAVAGAGTAGSEVCADEAADTGDAAALGVKDNDTGAGEGNGDSDGEGDGEGAGA